jgi:Transposase/zinc-finger of transposase IS204/IS1001/IS1096/IS1165
MMRWPDGALRRYAAARAMKSSITWSPAAGLNVVSVERREQAWTVTVDSRQPTFCPGCGAQSKSRHSTYWRTLWDLSAQGTPVIVNARLGRWRCRNQQCDRRIFTERVPSLAAPFARRTARLAGIVRLLGHGAGGRPSERLMRRLGMPVSDTTILAGLKEHAKARSESSAVAAVHVAGVDDWAWRKGANYGTIIVDLERREVVDVLVDRSAVTTASWFKDHPDVEVVSRDRAGLYAEAAREGAPQAREVADRFHLLQNFRETIERQLGGYEAPIPESHRDFPRSKFHEGFYRRLSNTFGHIANYDSAGFYGRFFLTAADKLEFLEQCVSWPCYGDPTYTYSDVERAIGARLRSASIVTLMGSQVSAARRQADLALLAELKARYEPIPHAPTPCVQDGSLPLFDLRKGAA